MRRDIADAAKKQLTARETKFACLVAGEPLDRAMLTGEIPSREHLVAGARDGVGTFLARYGVARTDPEGTA